MPSVWGACLNVQCKHQQYHAPGLRYLCATPHLAAMSETRLPVVDGVPQAGRKDAETMTDSDHGTIVICAVRYSMGRRTYMPHLVMDYVKRHWPELSQADRNIILRDVDEELVVVDHYNPKALGDEMDVREWREFLEWMKKQEGKP